MLPPGILLASCVALATLLSAGVARGAENGCQAWPGEPWPLPSVSSPDALAARWAELRVWEVTRLARQAERTGSHAAYQLWFHVACLDPESPDAREGLHLTRRVRVFRPRLVNAGPQRRPERARNADQAIAALGGSVAVQVPSSLAATAPELAGGPTPEEKAGVEGLLRRAETDLRSARFRTAIASAKEALALLDELSPEGAWQEEQRVRSEVIMATAEIALGRDDAAREHFARALRQDPGFELDPARTAPKVLRVLQAARTGQEPGQ
jgi:hypothetical protein